MSLYTYSWAGLDASTVRSELMPTTLAKISIGTVNPPQVITVDSGLNVLTPDEEEDLNEVLGHQGWTFVSKT